MITLLVQNFAAGVRSIPSSGDSSLLWNQPPSPSFPFPPASPVSTSTGRSTETSPGQPTEPTDLSPGQNAFGVLVLEDQSEVLLYPGNNLIGRSVAASVRLQDFSVSAEHAVLYVPDDPTTLDPLGVTLEDLGSEFGTYVSAHRLTRYRSEPLGHRDELAFGSVRANFYLLTPYLNEGLD